MPRLRFLPDRQRPKPTDQYREYGGRAEADGLATFSPDHPSNYVDISLGTPDQQFAALVSIIENADAANPAPNTHTPPFGEPIDESEYISEALQQEEYLLAPDLEAVANVDLDSVISDAYTAEIPEWDWENDDQYFGLGVPPGVPNYGQPFETGHTQITLPNPTIEYGGFAWSGKPVARVARHENNFPGYSAGVSRRHNMPPVLKFERQAWMRTQQTRDLLLAEIQRRGIHNVVIADVPSQSYTEQVQMVDPAVMTPEYDIGEAGVLP